MHYGSGFGYLYVIVAQILFFVFTVLLILWFVKNKGSSDLKEILDKRLATGEITVKEYHKLLKEISKEKVVN